MCSKMFFIFLELPPLGKSPNHHQHESKFNKNSKFKLPMSNDQSLSVMHVHPKTMYFTYFHNKDIQSSTRHFTYMTHEKSIIQTRSKLIYQFPNLNKNLNKWFCLETKVQDLACVNNKNIWIDKKIICN